MANKNYLKMFLNYCIKNEIWFAIYGDGSVDECTETDYGVSFYPLSNMMLGSKEAYDWLVKEHKKLINLTD